MSRNAADAWDAYIKARDDADDAFDRYVKALLPEMTLTEWDCSISGDPGDEDTSA